MNSIKITNSFIREDSTRMDLEQQNTGDWNNMRIDSL